VRPRHAGLAGLATLLALCLAGPAAAQTVIVRNAPAGSKVELLLNATLVATTSADTGGSATLVIPQPGVAKTGIDANVFVDACDDRHRILVVERVQAAAPEEPGCPRRELTGLFLVQPTSTMVVDVKGPIYTLLLRQGRFSPATPRERWSLSPTGLVASAGGDFSAYSDAAVAACGSGANCLGDGSGFSHTFGAGYWLLPFLGADVTYLRAGKMIATGNGDGYYFDTMLDTDVVTIAGMVGVPSEKMRFYGKGGWVYHEATHTTTQTIEEKTITVGHETQTIPGGSQVLAFQTSGWGWMFGGGAEIWLTRWFAAYGEGGYLKLKGKQIGGGDATMDDRMTTVQFGARFHLWH
jgi:hypothetical protein